MGQYEYRVLWKEESVGSTPDNAEPISATVEREGVIFSGVVTLYGDIIDRC